MNPDHFCMGCMTEREDGGPCPHCGFDEHASPPAPHQLPLRTILNGKYLIGRVLGEGGFGITYLGWDLNLDLKLAIKEYYPAGFVTREITGTNSITPFTGDSLEFFTRGRDKFINEAKTLARFYTLPGIVSVKDFFLENGTAYIVMEYLDGITLKQHLTEQGGKLSAAEVFALMEPLIKSLMEVHRAGLIHRDISPDNIMLAKDGSIKLLDFGAAREISSSGEKSNTVNIKTGYAPEEQYRTHGVQGPWTDIYALSATIYKCVTGITPDESLERIREDRLVPPSSLGVSISPGQEAALMKGLAVFQKNRFQNLEEFSLALYSSAPGSFVTPTVSDSVPTDKTIPLYPSPERSASTGYTAPAENSGKAGFSYGRGTSEATPSQAKKNRKNVLFAALAAVAILVVVSVVLTNQPSRRSLPTAAESSSSSFEDSSESNSSTPDSQAAVGSDDSASSDSAVSSDNAASSDSAASSAPDSSEAEPDSSEPSSSPKSDDLEMYLPSIQARYHSGQIKEVLQGKTVTTESHVTYTVKSGTLVSGKGSGADSQDYLKVTLDLGVAADQKNAMSMDDYDFVLITNNSSTNESKVCEPNYVMRSGKKILFPILVGGTETIDLMFPIPKGIDQANFVYTNFLNERSAGPLYVTYSK